MTVTNPARVSAGVPAGGQFTATSHTEPDISLTAPPRKSLTELHEARARSGAKLTRIYAQARRTELLLAHESLQAATATILAEYPTAVRFEISEADSQSGYLTGPVFDAEGNVLASDVSELGDEGGYENVQDLVFDIPFHNDRWSEGIAKDLTNKFHGKVFHIDLPAAMAKPAPFFEEDYDPRTRSFTEEEQDALVEAAFHGLDGLNESAEAADESDHRQRLEDTYKIASEVLTRRTEPADKS